MKYNMLSHFAIYTDDIERARNFYGSVFDWTFDSFGPPDFLQINGSNQGGGAPIGALQSRKYAPVKERITGLECSFSVKDIDDTIQLLRRCGATVVMDKTAIPSVGWIVKFLDTEDNLLCAIEYNPRAHG